MTLNRFLTKKGVFGGALLCSILFFASHSQGGTMSLNQAIILALEHDPTIRKIYADVMQARGYSTEVRSALRPHVRLESDAGYGYRARSIGGLATGGRDLFDRRAALIIEQLIWDNGFSCYKWKDAKCRRQAAILLDRAQRETTAMGTAEAFLYVLKARKQIHLARRNVSSHSRFYNLARDRANGQGNEADVELARARLKLASALLKERELDLKQAEADFIRYVGQRPPSLCDPRTPVIGGISSVDPTQNYHYQAVLHQCKAAQLASAAIRRSHAPRVFVRGTGSYGEDVLGIQGTDEELSALLVMQWNLFEGGRRKGLQRQAEGDIARQVAIAEETKVLLDRDILARWSDYSTLNERIGILEEYRSGLADTVDLYRKQFELDKRPLLGVLDIENEKISSEMRLVDDRYERALNAYRLLFFGGRLTVSTAGEQYICCEPEWINLECPGGACLSCEDECLPPCPNSSCPTPAKATPVIYAAPATETPKRRFGLFRKKNRTN